MLPLDPFADPARRAWLSCPSCDLGRNCPVCQARRTCDDHWQYLLGSTGPTVHLQCPACLHLWDHTARRTGQLTVNAPKPNNYR
jgi:hypothetical protein